MSKSQRVNLLCWPRRTRMPTDDELARLHTIPGLAAEVASQIEVTMPIVVRGISLEIERLLSRRNSTRRIP
ncbi:MAG TPA: hypothetical protein VMF32_15945 [Xanthobacteraceae bacterium]|nr:hypothetical protein [Xanthobacteraceae bacterium]